MNCFPEHYPTYLQRKCDKCYIWSVQRDIVIQNIWEKYSAFCWTEFCELIGTHTLKILFYNLRLPLFTNEITYIHVSYYIKT
jgi:hypothetical protein